jgi:type IV pilus assembly protein PilP
MHTILRTLVFAAGIALAAAVSAQQTAPQNRPQASPAAAAAAAPANAPPAVGQGAAPQAPPPPTYSYDPQGRRDPFVSLLLRGNDPRLMANRPAGPPGLLISEVTVKGIVRDRSGFIAMIQGADTKTYMVRVADKLMDGSVKSISADVVVFSQDVNDPLSTIKQKEVRKSVRPLEDGGA